MSVNRILRIDASYVSLERRKDIWETLRTYTDAHWIAETPGVFTALFPTDSSLLENPVFAGCKIEDITQNQETHM